MFYEIEIEWNVVFNIYKDEPSYRRIVISVCTILRDETGRESVGASIKIRSPFCKSGIVKLKKPICPINN